MAYELFAVSATDAGVTRVESLQQLLTSSDCITLHCSKNQHSTRPIINQCTLRQMRPGSLFTVRPKLHYTGYGHVVQHHQRTSSQQFYNKFATSQCQSPTSRQCQDVPHKCNTTTLQLLHGAILMLYYYYYYYYYYNTKFCCIAAVRISAIQLQYKKKFLYCSCIVVVLHLCGPL